MFVYKRQEESLVRIMPIEFFPKSLNFEGFGKNSCVPDTYDDLLQGIIEVSGETGPSVDPDHPVDPDDPSLVGHASIWDNN